MSLLHPAQQPKQYGSRELSLEGLPVDLSITMLADVQKYGSAIAQELSMPNDFTGDVEVAAAGVVRSAIDKSISARELSPQVVDRILAGKIDDTISPSQEQNLIEEVEFKQALRHSFEVKPDELAFMARCVLRGAVRADDDAERKQSQLTFDWLEQGPQTRRVVEWVIHPTTARSKQAAQAVGKAAFTPFVRAKAHPTRGLRTRAS